MSRRIVTAREQYAMLSPWRLAASAADAYDPDAPDKTRHLRRGPTPTGPWYHASPHDLPDGTVLNPHHQSAGNDYYYKSPDRAGRADWVWMERDPWAARMWSTTTKNPYVYEVEPVEGPYAWNGSSADGWVAPHATIRRRVTAANTLSLPLGIPRTQPAPLYRGITLDLKGPEAAIVRRSLFGNAFEDYRAPDEGTHAPCRGCPHPDGPPRRPPGPGDGVQGRLPYGRDFSDQALGTNGKARWSRMGRDVLDLVGPDDDLDWTDDPETAHKMALDGKRNALQLPVVISRTSPHGAVSGVRILHPEKKSWHDILPPEDRLAALKKTLVDNLEDEFNDWWDNRPETQSRFPSAIPYRPIRNWKRVEEFLKDRYPEAHRGLTYGFEQAGRLLDDKMMYKLPEQPVAPYETGPEAMATHGYDPKEIAAAMLLLHQEADPARADLSDEDQQRLTDIAQKRHQMQKAYEQRTAMPTLYHHTSPEAAEAIRKERKFRPNSEYDEFSYFSDKPDGWGSGWGDSRIDVNVPDDDFEYDFEEDPYQDDGINRPPAGETFWRARSKDIKPEWIA